MLMFGETEPSAGPRARGRGCGSPEGVMWSPARGEAGKAKVALWGKASPWARWGRGRARESVGVL